MHINDYFLHMFPEAECDLPIDRGIPGTDDYDMWTLSTECGIVTCELCIAATRFLDLIEPHDVISHEPVYEIVRDQIRVFCYG